MEIEIIEEKYFYMLKNKMSHAISKGFKLQGAVQPYFRSNTCETYYVATMVKEKNNGKNN